ncbi:DUF302 domain-containing protein [Aquimarina sp. 2201CG5-10]|uniref:DUF302 domain-containing protein n=1 Tax=Aquimarina callyspongiae TaxID=3098150 RepID=UPI002AB4105A|nr:DUF302 domain-containing protein [Aquimarina sp. 2201CG5-10]MDY8136542.1 DUF302 domain-containing protein [Aquimarina sp. 2201CG5-10]
MTNKVWYWFLLVFILMSCNQKQNNTSKEGQIVPKKNMEITTQQGIITKKSTKNFEETYNSLIKIITNNPNLKIIAELDHQNNAGSVGLDLRPTRIVLFGNPRLGTPLMQNSQTTGLDLPQKILVWQDSDDNINISYNNPAYLQKRHEITGNEEILKKVSGALDNITNGAAGL